MFAVILTSLAVSIYIALRLLEEIQILPRQHVARIFIERGVATLLIATLVFFPSAYTTGTRRWVEYRTDQIMEDFQSWLDRTADPHQD